MSPLKHGSRTEIAELFLMLCLFSIRAKQIPKALLYSRIGHQLYPDDPALFEYYAYATMLSGDLEDANNLLNASSAKTPNIHFLRARVAMLRESSADEIRRNLTVYLELAG